MMTDFAFAIIPFAVAMLFSPGPNNLMLMASGANFGVQRSVPHLIGVAWGFPLMVIPVGLGIMQLFDLWPPAFTVLQAVAMVYLLYLAWKIANAAPPKEAAETASPLTLFQAAAFQWVNPKAWSIALGAITLFAADRDFGSVLAVAGSLALVGTVSALTWVTLGTGIRRILTRPNRLRIFNIAMALALVGSMVPTLLYGAVN